MRRVFADTSVLFPFSVMDLLLALAENGIHHILWTDELLDEWERVIVREHRRTAQSAAAVTGAIREFFSDTRIDLAQYRDRINEMPGPDPDDHVHSAAALADGADALLTWDTSGFPVAALGQLGLRVVDPDTYLIEVLDEFPNEVHATIETLVRSRTRPPMTRVEVLSALQAAGLAAFTRRVRDA